LGPGEPVRAAAAKVKVPIFVTTASGHEVDVARWILDGSPSALKVQYVPTVGVHGSSTLRKDRNPGGADEKLGGSGELSSPVALALALIENGLKRRLQGHRRSE
jgi:hypothetical protein